jgi:hypothetical protein
MSSLFHEFAALSIILLCIILYLLNRKKIRNTEVMYFKLLATSIIYIILYGLFVIIPNLNLIQLSIFEYLNDFSYYSLTSLIQANINHKSLFFLAKTIVIISLVISIFILIYIKIRKEMIFKEQMYLVYYIVPLLSLSLLVILGRVIPRGGYNPWYEVMIYYFIILTSSVLVGNLLNKKIIITIMIKFSILLFPILLIINLQKRIEENTTRYQSNYIWGQMVHDINNYIKSENICILGFDGLNTDEMNLINIQFFKMSCSYLNRIPVLIEVEKNSSKNLITYKKLLIEKEYLSIDAISIIKNELLNEFEYKYIESKKLKPIKHATKNNILCNGIRSINKKDIEFNSVALNTKPVKYNFYIAFYDATNKNLNLQVFNENIVDDIDFFSQKKIKNKSSLYLNNMHINIKIQIKNFNNNYYVIFNNQLIKILKNVEPLDIFICKFEQ